MSTARVFRWLARRRTARVHAVSAARVFRWLAVAIALAAVLDPAITTRRRVDAVVAIVAADPTWDAALADRVERELKRTFTTVRAPLGSAAATVLIGTRLPALAGGSGGPAFAALSDSLAVSIAAVHAPARAPLAARVPVVAVVDVAGTTAAGWPGRAASGRLRSGAQSPERRAGRNVDVSLLADDVVLDRASVAVTDAHVRLRVPLWFVPSRHGAARLRVRAALGDDDASAAVDLAVDVRDNRWAVLFYDPRPSWLSTFVRRTLEQDPRFVVTSRTVTARDVATEFGRAPRGLEDGRALARFDVIVVGAPEALADGAVAGLEQFLRRRGGGVVLLLDRGVGGAYERLAGVRIWTGSSGPPLELSAVGTPGGLRAAQVVWPARLPPLARPLAARLDDGTAATANAAAADADASIATTAPAVWRVPVGAGALVVSGALDAWRFRDPERSGFETFWPALIAQLADAAPAPVDVALSGAVARPGAWTDVRITLRDAALADLSTGQTVRGGVVAAIDGNPIHVWPSPDVGVVSGRFRAPDRPGVYTITAAADGARSHATLVVDDDVAYAAPDERALLRAWTTSRGGSTGSAFELRGLSAQIERVVRAERHAERWHPMRSAWWIVPFALALGGEWYSRRRRGLL